MTPDPFSGFEEPTGDKPEDPTPAATSSTNSTFDPFASKQAETTTESLPALPEIAAGTVVQEPATGRVGLVVKAGELEAEPSREGPKHAVAVAWFDHVSAPVPTDQVKVVS